MKRCYGSVTYNTDTATSIQPSNETKFYCQASTTKFRSDRYTDEDRAHHTFWVLLNAPQHKYTEATNESNCGICKNLLTRTSSTPIRASGNQRLLSCYFPTAAEASNMISKELKQAKTTAVAKRFTNDGEQQSSLQRRCDRCERRLCGVCAETLTQCLNCDRLVCSICTLTVYKPSNYDSCSTCLDCIES